MVDTVWVLTYFDADTHDYTVTLHRTMEGARDEGARVTEQYLEWIKVGEGLTATAHDPLIHLHVWREEIRG